MSNLIRAYRDMLYTVSGLITSAQLSSSLYNSVQDRLTTVGSKVALAQLANEQLGRGSLCAAKKTARTLYNSYTGGIPSQVSVFLADINQVTDASLATTYKVALGDERDTYIAYLSQLSDTDVSFYGSYLQIPDVTLLDTQILTYRNTLHDYSLIIDDVSLTRLYGEYIGAHQAFYNNAAIMRSQYEQLYYSAAATTANLMYDMAATMYCTSGLLLTPANPSDPHDIDQSVRLLLLDNLQTLGTVLNKLSTYKSLNQQVSRLSLDTQSLIDSSLTLTDISGWHNDISLLETDYPKFPIMSVYNAAAMEAIDGLTYLYDALYESRQGSSRLIASSQLLRFATLSDYTSLVVADVLGLPGSVVDISVSYPLQGGAYQLVSSNPDVATISDEQRVSMHAAGTAQLTVNINSLSASSTIYVYDAVLSAVQGNVDDTYTVELDIQSVGYPSFPLNRVIYETDDSNIATVSGNIVKLVSAGTTNLMATLDQGSVTSTIQVYENLIQVQSISFDLSLYIIGLGQQLQPTYEIYPSNASVQSTSLASTDQNILQGNMNDSDIFYGQAAGTAYVVATALDGSDVSARTMVIVRNLITNLTILTTSVPLGLDTNLLYQTTPINPTISGLRWQSNNTSVLTVSASGIAHGHRAGVANVTATAIDGGGVSTTVSITVVPNGQLVTSVTMGSISSPTLYYGKRLQLRATVEPRNAIDKSLVWTNSNTNAATIVVSSAGCQVTAVGTGQTTISVTTQDGSNLTDSVDLDCVVPITKITLTPVSMLIGQQHTVVPVILPQGATMRDVIYTSSKGTVASIDTEGVVTANLNGTTTIAATATDGTRIKGSATYTVASVKTLSLSKTGTVLLRSIPTTLALKATLTPSNAINKTVTWTTSDEDVATVNSVGLVTSVGFGTCTITATADDTSDEDKIATVIISVNVPISSIKFKPPPMLIGDTYQITPAILPTNATNTTLTYTSSNTQVATVNDTGLITAINNGSVKITVTATDGSNTKASVSCLVASVKGLTLSPSNETIVLTAIPKTTRMRATITPSNSINKAVSWLSNNTSVATVDNTGTVTSVGFGTCVITASADDESDSTCQDQVTIQVYVPVKTVRFTMTAMTVNATQQVNPVITPSNASTQTLQYSSSNTSVATVNSTGLVTAVAVGRATIMATATDGSSVKGSVALRVS